VEARQTAKNLLTEEVTTTLDGLPSLAGHERPHWFIHDQLKEVADELLLVSPSVKEYIADLDMKKLTDRMVLVRELVFDFLISMTSSE